ncbi:hypothetical protein C0991_001531 [Blastosporella zonata]|nr:hypothetical protein C0991_001531 [Blastosporella zonata]
MLNWFLYGILVMQIYIYYQCFPEDSRKIKMLVYGMFMLDSLQSVLATADAFHWLAKGYGNMFMLAQPFISAFDAPMLDGIIGFIVQTFFCWRIRVLQKSWWLPLSVFSVALLWLGGSALTDTLIAVVMTVLLLRSRTREHEQTDNILVRIVRLTVETNTVTASVAIIVLVCLLAIPKNPSISMAPAYALGKLYSNTLLAVFNNRVYMSSRGIVPRSRTLATTGIDFKFHQQPSESSRNRTSQSHIESREPYRIEVFRETEVTQDVPMKTLGDGVTASSKALDHSLP